MNVKKYLSLGTAVVITLSACAACSEKSDETADKINLKIGGWPNETQPEYLQAQNKKKDDFMQEYNNINIIPDTYLFDTKTFTAKAAAKQLPDLWAIYFTEAEQVIKDGQVADITNEMKESGFDTSINPMLLDMVTKDGKIYGIPSSAYAQGLYINKKLFKEAGLVNEDGSIKVPDSYEELAEYAGIIKEKTGKAGYIMPTVNNCGGWHFLNIAWSFGTEFVKQRDDGSWEAAFDTQEARNALQYIKDLKWKYNALMDDSVIELEDMKKYFGTYQAAMMFADPPTGVLTEKYDMELNDIFVGRMPKGRAGRFSQMGGGIWFFTAGATHEQIDAGIKWLKFTGFTPDITEDSEKRLREGYELALKNNGIILDQEAFDIWTNPESMEKLREIRNEYTNVKHEDYEQYYGFDEVTIKPEPAVCAQQLYAILDGCIQEVITNENADVDKLISTAAKDYQVNHLDKM